MKTLKAAGRMALTAWRAVILVAVLVLLALLLLLLVAGGYGFDDAYEGTFGSLG